MFEKRKLETRMEARIVFFLFRHSSSQLAIVREESIDLSRTKELL